MKDTYQLYAGQPPVSAAQAQETVARYNEAIRNNQFTRYKHIIEMIPDRAGKVLDYGCGWGCITKAIAEKGNEVIGIDQFEGALEVACDFNPHKGVQYLSRNITEFEPEVFDVVNSNQVLEHVHNPGIYLRNANRVLKINGLLVISVPNIINLQILAAQLRFDHSVHYKKISADALANYSKDRFHIQGWEPRTFIHLHASLGFEYVAHRFLEGVVMPFGRARHTRVPFAGKYFHTRLPGLRNLSYTMLFAFRKKAFVDIQPED